MNLPKIVSRERVDKLDWWGWIMSILGLVLMAHFGGIFGTEKNWWLFAAVFFTFWEYMNRVAFGKIKMFVYYDTIIHRLYEIEIQNGNIFYVNAETEDELDLYMDVNYPNLEFKILKKTHTESFIKTEKHV